MKLLHNYFIALAGWSALFIMTAQAQSTCAPSDAMVGSLTGEQYGEWPLFNGTTQPQPNAPEISVSVFANPRTGTWSMVVFPDSKTACMFAVGKDFKPAPPLKIKGRGL